MPKIIKKSQKSPVREFHAVKNEIEKSDETDCEKGMDNTYAPASWHAGFRGSQIWQDLAAARAIAWTDRLRRHYAGPATPSSRLHFLVNVVIEFHMLRVRTQCGVEKVFGY